MYYVLCLKSVLCKNVIERFLQIPEDNISEIGDICDVQNIDEFQTDKKLYRAFVKYNELCNEALEDEEISRPT